MHSKYVANNWFFAVVFGCMLDSKDVIFQFPEVQELFNLRRVSLLFYFIFFFNMMVEGDAWCPEHENATKKSSQASKSRGGGRGGGRKVSNGSRTLKLHLIIFIHVYELSKIWES